MEVVGIVGMVALVWKVVDFLRLLANLGTQRSAVFTQLAAWVGAVVVVALYAGSDLGNFPVPGTDLVLDQANGWTLVVLGLAIGSTASAAVDVKQAIDNTDNATKPPLLR